MPPGGSEIPELEAFQGFGVALTVTAARILMVVGRFAARGGHMPSRYKGPRKTGDSRAALQIRGAAKTMPRNISKRPGT